MASIRNSIQRHPLTKLENVCGKLGLSIKYGGETYFQDKTIYVFVHGNDFKRDNIKYISGPFSSLAHELAHYLVAKPGQRKLKNYAFRDNRRSKARILYEDTEELKTQLVEILIFNKLKQRREKLEKVEKRYASREYNWPALGWWLDNKEKYKDLIDLLFV